LDNKKSLTIGITINLDNYENLRLELEGEIDDDRDAANLVSDLDRILSGLGRGDEVTAERIDSYRRRVLSHTINKDEVKRTPQMDYPTEKGPDAEIVTPAIETSDKKIRTDEIKGAQKGGSLFSYDDKKDTGEPVKKEESPDEAANEPGSEDIMKKPDLVCESCGATITEKQRKISQMFTDKNLCEKCIQAEQGMKQ
jgi:hypothetical protein